MLLKMAGRTLRLRTSNAAPRPTNKTNSVAAKLRWRTTTTTRSLSAATEADHPETETASASASSTGRMIKPWKTPVVESRGDYRQEAWLEEWIGGPLYEKQKNLPRLPVPTVQETLARFMPTAMPLARSQLEQDSLQSAVDCFANQAAVLQNRLLDRQVSAANADSSWLQHWWNTAGYLKVRDSVVVNVSYFFHFSDDATASSSNVKRGAALLSATADYRLSVVTGQLPPDHVGRKEPKTPLCSVAYKYMFHACRIPVENRDAYRLYDPALHAHAVVARHGFFFAVPLADASTGHALPLDALEASLSECLESADRLQALPEQEQPYKLGWLTSKNRDDWAHARDTLLALDPAIEQDLELLQSGAVLLCLDDQEPVSLEECGRLFCFGDEQGGNRWFDKSVQLFCTENGKAGLMGEHSMMDGMPVTGLANRITELTYAACQEREASREGSAAVGKGNRSGASSVTPIFGNLRKSPQVQDLVEKAKQEFTALVSGQALNVQSFHGYGSDFIKQSGFSPDAYVQMAMQVATYRLWGEQVGTYEATQVRPFLHGRTETTRTVSTQSSAFVHQMGIRPKMDETDSTARKEKLRLLQEAVDAHVKYIGLAAKAQGVDRHFMGLSMLVKDGETPPDLYSDPVFARSKRWRVSTSHLTHPEFDNWGYGEVYPDGVGLAYSIHKRHCIFNITALRELGWTDKLSQLLEEAMLEMRTLIEIDKPPTSRL